MPTELDGESQPETPIDRWTSVALGVVFLLACAFYIWTAGTSSPITFHNGGVDRYNLLATAFLHLRLSIGPAPTGLVHLAEPYNPLRNGAYVDHGFNDATNFNDDVLYRGHLYFLWGPAPALVFLVPMHLLGFEPSASVTVSFFAIVGLGFALLTLRLLLRQIGNTSVSISVLAAAALALCSAMPFLLRTPSVTEDVIAGGFCFTMAGVWLAFSTVSRREGSLPRLALMSLCFGLAAGSRATLAPTALVLVPVYLSLRSTRPRRGMLLALIVPVSVCFLLLLGYNQARFGDPFQFGFLYQLAGYDPLDAHFTSIRYLLPGAWFYTLSLPRLLALFPFLSLAPPPISYPASLPAHYTTPEITGGLLPLTPILLFVPVLPWMWRRRPAWLGQLASPLLAVTTAGILILLLLSYEVFSTTERYEVDFSTLLLFGALAAWLILSHRTHGYLRRLVQIGGGMLVTWGCLTGLAISFVGYGNYLAVDHPATWASLQNAFSPLSTVIARTNGAPLLAEVDTPDVLGGLPVGYTTLTSGIDQFWLEAKEQASFTIVSPDTRSAALAMEMTSAVHEVTGNKISRGPSTIGATFHGARETPISYLIPPGGRRLLIPLPLHAGINRFELSPIASTMRLPDRRHPTTSSALVVTGLSLDAP